MAYSKVARQLIAFGRLKLANQGGKPLEHDPRRKTTNRLRAIETKNDQLGAACPAAGRKTTNRLRAIETSTRELGSLGSGCCRKTTNRLRAIETTRNVPPRSLQHPGRKTTNRLRAIETKYYPVGNEHYQSVARQLIAFGRLKRSIAFAYLLSSGTSQDN